MKKFLLLLVVAAMFPVQMLADEPQTSIVGNYEHLSFGERFLSWETPTLYTKFELRIGAPIYDLNHLSTFARAGGYYHPAGVGGAEVIYGGSLYNEYAQSAYKSGGCNWGYAPEVSFMVKWDERFQIGVIAGFAWMHQNRYSVLTSEIVEENDAYMLLLNPTLRYNIISNNWLRFYVQAGLYNILTYQNIRKFWDEVELFCGYGMAVGGRIYLFAEANFGSMNTYTQSLGVGYRF